MRSLDSQTRSQYGSTPIFTYLERQSNIDWRLVVDVDSYLAFVDILGIVVDDNLLWVAKLATDFVLSEEFLRGKSPRNPNNVQQLLFDNPEGHQFFHSLLDGQRYGVPSRVLGMTWHGGRAEGGHGSL